MTWHAIARKDFRDALRSKTIWLLFGGFVVLFLGITYAAWREADAAFLEFVDLTAAVFGLLLPLVSITLGYKAVIAERESGSLALTLSFPHARWELVVGKFIGRSAVLAPPVVVGMVVAGAFIVFQYDTFPVGRYLLFAGLNVLYGLAFLGLALCLSMSTVSSRRVTAGAFGGYVLLVVLWADLVELLVLVLWRFDAAILLRIPDWALFAQLLSPVEAYSRLITALFDSDFGGAYAGSNVPWFVDAWVALVVLVGWVTIPVALGYLRFKNTDL